jgi:site-specific recombinase XerD
MALLYGCGLRITEAATLPLGALRGATLVVVGKGNKEKELPLGHVGGMLTPWLRARGAAPGPLLCHLDRSGSLRRPLRGLTSAGLTWALDRLRARAGLAPFTPHDLRRTFASQLLDRQVPLREVQMLMRHEDIRTTQTYDRRPLTQLGHLVRRLPL